MNLKRNESGMALVIVLWIAVILGSLASAAAYLVRLEIRQAGYPAGEIQLVSAAAAGLEKVKSAVRQDNYGYTSLKGSWNSFLGETFVSGDVSVIIDVEDEESKLNLNNAAPASLLKLFPISAAPNAQELVDSLSDWIDIDSLARSGGAEEGCMNRPLDCLDELYLVKGFSDDKLMRSLKKVATVSSDGRININTAPAEVLAALPGMDSGLALAVIARRNGADLLQGTEDDLPYDSVLKVKEIIGEDAYKEIENILTVKSGYFKVTLTASSGSRSRRIEALLYGNGDRVRAGYWREL